MLGQSTIDMWNGYTNSQTPQEFMDISRDKGLATIEQAVDAYVAEITPDWAGDGLTADEANKVRRSLIHYLEATQGEEWDIA